METIIYSRTRRNYRLEVIAEAGRFTGKFAARITNLTTGAHCTDYNWNSQEIALKVVQGMYQYPTI